MEMIALDTLGKLHGWCADLRPIGKEQIPQQSKFSAGYGAYVAISRD
jgi:hypothetical protein